MDLKTPSWGIEPVPERLRVLGLLDLGLLWGSLGVSLLVIVAGPLLVGDDFLALSFKDALLAIAVGGLIGNAMLGLGGMIGADGRVPAMVLMRASLGRQGSYLATILNVAQCIGWAIFELIVIATAAAALSEEVFGFEAKWVWTLVFGAVALALALLGPIGVVRRVLRRFAVWLVLASLVYLTWWALDGADLGSMWNAKAEDGASVWEGIDLVVALTVTWIPLAPDYTRFATKRRAAFLGTGIGYLIPTFWMWGLGVVLFLSRGLDDAAALPASVASAGVVSALALIAVTADETDEAFANAYSAAVSTQNVLTKVPQRALIVAAVTASTAGALFLELSDYQTFLYMLGSFFVPLFGVLLADWLLARAHYTEADIFEAPRLRIGLIGAWLVGFALYQWLLPQGPGWWVDFVTGLPSAPTWGIGATLPSFAVSFSLAALASLAYRRPRTALAET